MRFRIYTLLTEFQDGDSQKEEYARERLLQPFIEQFFSAATLILARLHLSLSIRWLPYSAFVN